MSNEEKWHLGRALASEISSKDYRRPVKIPCATDDEVLSACESGRVDWSYTEYTELGVPLAELSESAREFRGIVKVLLDNPKQTEIGAEQKYREMVARSNENNERKILFLNERVDKLFDEGAIDKDMYREYLASEEDIPDRVRYLLSGLSAEEALWLEKFRRKTRHERTPQGEQKERILFLKMRGLTEGEAQAYIYRTSSGRDSADGTSILLRSRADGLPVETARRFAELAVRMHNHEPLTSQERQEHRALINYRHLLAVANGELETRLAANDFGLDRLFRYVYLMTRERAAEKNAKSIIPKSFGRLSEDQWETMQNTVDAVYQHHRISDEEQQELDGLYRELQKEPLLRHLRHEWQDLLINAIG